MERLNEDHSEPYTPEERDPDYRFSEAAGYSNWEPPKRNWLRIAVTVVSVLVLLSMALPMITMLAVPHR